MIYKDKIYVVCPDCENNIECKFQEKIDTSRKIYGKCKCLVEYFLFLHLHDIKDEYFINRFNDIIIEYNFSTNITSLYDSKSVFYNKAMKQFSGYLNKEQIQKLLSFL